MRVPHFLPSSYTDEDAFTDLPADPLCMAFPIKGEYATSLDAPVTLSWRPLQISVSKGVKWWWRVKAWKLTIEGTGINGFSPQEITLQNAAVSTELDLCDWFNRLGGHFFEYGSGGGTFTTSIGAGTLNVTPRFYYLGQGFVGIPAYQMTDVVSPDTVDFLPTMGFYCDLSWDDGISISGQYIGTSYDSAATNDHESSASMDGETLTVRWTVFSGDDFGDIEMTLEPESYWQYLDVNNANPIWNASTGAQLRSVLTGETI